MIATLPSWTVELIADAPPVETAVTPATTAEPLFWSSLRATAPSPQPTQRARAPPRRTSTRRPPGRHSASPPVPRGRSGARRAPLCTRAGRRGADGDEKQAMRTSGRGALPVESVLAGRCLIGGTPTRPLVQRL